MPSPILKGFLGGALIGATSVAFGLLSKAVEAGGTEPSWLWLAPPLAMGALGAALPKLAPALLSGYRSLLKPLGVSSTDITLPFLGTVPVQLGNPQRTSARKIFFEIATRTVTQPLPPGEGSIEVALKSAYAVFQTVRTEITEMAPTPPHADPKVETLESIASRMLNVALRPYLTRWHPRLDRWIADGHDEADWPHNQLCREDLDRMRIAMTGYAYSMANAASIPCPEESLPPKPAAKEIPDGNLLERDAEVEIERLDGLAGRAPTLVQQQLTHSLAGALSATAVAFSTGAEGQAELRALAGVIGRTAPKLLTAPEGVEAREALLDIQTEFEERVAGSEGEVDLRAWASWCREAARTLRSAVDDSRISSRIVGSTTSARESAEKD